MISQIVNAKLLNKNKNREVEILNPRELDLYDLNQMMQRGNQNISLGSVKISEGDFSSNLVQRNDMFDLYFEYFEYHGNVGYLGHGYIKNCRITYRPIPKEKSITELTLEIFQLVLSLNSKKQTELYPDDEE